MGGPPTGLASLAAKKMTCRHMMLGHLDQLWSAALSTAAPPEVDVYLVREHFVVVDGVIQMLLFRPGCDHADLGNGA